MCFIYTTYEKCYLLVQTWIHKWKIFGKQPFLGFSDKYKVKSTSFFPLCEWGTLWKVSMRDCETLEAAILFIKIQSQLWVDCMKDFCLNFNALTYSKTEWGLLHYLPTKTYTIITWILGLRTNKSNSWKIWLWEPQEKKGK